MHYACYCISLWLQHDDDYYYYYYYYYHSCRRYYHYCYYHDEGYGDGVNDAVYDCYSYDYHYLCY